jgi:hypothetical protein
MWPLRSSHTTDSDIKSAVRRSDTHKQTADTGRCDRIPGLGHGLGRRGSNQNPA